MTPYLRFHNCHSCARQWKHRLVARKLKHKGNFHSFKDLGLQNEIAQDANDRFNSILMREVFPQVLY